MIHKFSMLGVNMAVDVPSGSVHILDDAAYRLLDDYNEEGVLLRGDLTQEESEAKTELDRLIQDGLLFSGDPYEAIAKHWDKQSVVKALCLHIAHDCNLRCAYCFAGTGEFHGARSMMSAEVGKKAIDFVIRASGNRKNIEIDYFGGEPLMNFGVVKEITEYAKEEGKKHGKNFRFTITTNGVLLSEDKMAYINENMSNVVLSIDGRKEVNDRVRSRVDGSGCYDSIMPKFQKLAESRHQDNYYVRGTFTAYNTDFAEDVKHLADLGFQQISVEPVVAPDSEPYALKEEHLDAVCQEYERLTQELFGRWERGEGVNFFHFMMDFEQGPCAYKRLSGCGAGHEYVAVTPDGEIYPCHQFVGDKDFLMGTVDTGIRREDIRTMFEKTNIYTKDACKECWARFYCSGGCSANAYNYNGSIEKPYEISCKLQRKRTECAMVLAAKKLLSEEKA